MHLRAFCITAPLVLLASRAEAHFRLDEPPSSNQQATNGDPQKPASSSDGCPAGTATGLVTQVRAGGQVRVKITETVPHGGHYRVSFGPNEAAFKFPSSVATNNQCQSTTIEQTPALPTLADGLFVHDQTMASAGNVCNGTKSCETMVTIPATAAPGNYLLQVIQWMVPHASAANNGIHGCFYAHCANVQVVEPNVAIADGGVVFTDAGSLPTDTTSDTTPGDGSDASSGTPENESRSRTLRSTEPADGCDISSANGPSFCVPLLGVLAAVRVLRRRKRG